MTEIYISIKIPEGSNVHSTVGPDVTQQFPKEASPHSLLSLSERHDELVAQMGTDISPFPSPKVGGYLSHFRFSIRFDAEPLKGKVISVVSPPAAQSVAWGSPFIYQGSAAGHRVVLPVPGRSGLPNIITEADFMQRPEKYFVVGKETLWLQILNLDARMDSEIGPIRIILGETLKRAHPDIFKPSLGAAQSLGRSGFPATLFFNPYAVVETRFGAFRAVHGTLAYGRVTAFPPIGTPVSICEQIPFELIESVKEAIATNDPTKIREIGRIVALTHPIDMEIHEQGEGAYDLVNALIEAAAIESSK